MTILISICIFLYFLSFIRNFRYMAMCSCGECGIDWRGLLCSFIPMPLSDIIMNKWEDEIEQKYKTRRLVKEAKECYTK